VKRIVTRKGKTSQEVACGVTSLSLERTSPQQLLALGRWHWGIEDRLHWVRDVTLDKDRCQVRCGSGPQVMAVFRNLTISLLCLAGHRNIDASLRRNTAHPAEALALVGITWMEH